MWEEGLVWFGRGGCFDEVGGGVLVWEERVFGVGGAGVWCWRAGVLV